MNRILGVCLFLSSACATTMELRNTSPVPVSATSLQAAPIQKTVVLLPAEGDSHLHIDVAEAFETHSVFEELVSSSDKKRGLYMRVRAETESDHHWASSIGKAALSGLTFGIAGTTQSDHFDFSVSVRADLLCNEESVGQYKSTGSYSSEVPEVVSLETKQSYVRQAVTKSYEHALARLASELKDDRDRIESLECKQEVEKKPQTARLPRGKRHKRRRR